MFYDWSCFYGRLVEHPYMATCPNLRVCKKNKRNEIKPLGPPFRGPLIKPTYLILDSKLENL